MPANITTGASFLLGMTHGLEPGHGKSFLAAYLLGEKMRWKQIFSMGFSMLVSHFLLLLLLAIILKYALGTVHDHELMEQLEIAGPIIIIVFGVVLFIRYYRKNRRGDHGPDCNCPAHRNETTVHTPASPGSSVLLHQPSNLQGQSFSFVGHADASVLQSPLRETPTTTGRAAAVGFLTGLIPCPTALTPILLASTSGFSQTIELLLLYVGGMSVVLTSFIAVMIIAKDFMARQLEKVEQKVDIRLLSAGLIILVGVIYLAMIFMDQGHGHSHVH